MTTRKELTDFLEIEEIQNLEENIWEHEDWDSIVELDLANLIEKQLNIEFDLSSYDKFSWHDLFKLLKV
jgi:hypothetical protein